ncbi:MAG TPA: hypothetical protein VKI45_10575 [Allosphingosinicella sp.]|nr:hypothetical protein [Allosphingosinicella sp.]
MFMLTKPDALTTAGPVAAEVERKLEPLAYEIERDDGQVTYKISSFAPGIRYSMFGAFSEVSLTHEGGSWVLRMKPTRLLLVPFAIFLVGLLAFWAIGPIDLAGGLIVAALPVALVLLTLIRARMRLGNWWNQL